MLKMLKALQVAYTGGNFSVKICGADRLAFDAMKNYVNTHTKCNIQNVN